MSDQIMVQQWQPFYTALAGASAALAGLVFVAMSLHPWPILSHRVMRARAFAAAFGFLLGVAWALIMLMPASIAPVASVLLIVVGAGESLFIGYRQLQIRSAGMNVALVLLADLLMPAPILAGIVGLLRPHAAFPFALLAIMAGVGLFVLFFQSWSLVVHSVLNAPDSQHPEPPREIHAPAAAANQPPSSARTETDPA